MRKEAVYTLLLNVTLFSGMLAALAPQDPRYLRFSAIENGATTHYNLRVRCCFHALVMHFPDDVFSWAARKQRKTC